MKIWINEAATLECSTIGSAIGLREDFGRAALRRLSRTTKSANQARRLLALAEIYDGEARLEFDVARQPPSMQVGISPIEFERKAGVA